MDIKAVRQDLAQKAMNANKVQFTEDYRNNTFSGIRSEAQAENYRQLAEQLQIELNDLNALIETVSSNIRLGAETRKKIKNLKKEKPKQSSNEDKKVISEEKLRHALRSKKLVKIEGAKAKQLKRMAQKINIHGQLERTGGEGSKSHMQEIEDLLHQHNQNINRLQTAKKKI